jgi:hypothetical protein
MEVLQLLCRTESRNSRLDYDYVVSMGWFIPFGCLAIRFVQWLRTGNRPGLLRVRYKSMDRGRHPKPDTKEQQRNGVSNHRILDKSKSLYAKLLGSGLMVFYKGEV